MSTQLYRDPRASIEERVEDLLSLMTLDEKLAFYDPHMRFVTEPGAFTFSIGASSADIQAEQTVTLDGQVVEYWQQEVVDTQVEVAPLSHETRRS